MFKTAREALDALDEFMSSQSPDVPRSEIRKLSAVLSAYRGPDGSALGEDFGARVELKERTTCQIRTKAFPKTAVMCNSEGWSRTGLAFADNACRPVREEVSYNDPLYHFKVHVQMAASALWDE